MTMPSSLRVHLDREWWTQSWAIYVWAGGTPNRLLWTPNERDGRFDQIDNSTVPEPSLRLPEDVLKLLVDAAAEKLPAGGGMAAHLADAQTVRDRLLTMIEKKGV